MQIRNQMKAFIAGAFVAYLLISPSNEMVQEKTVYFQYCNDFKHDSFSCPGDLRLFKQEIKVFLDQQIVVMNGLVTYNHKNCAIFDRNNWTCDEGERRVAMQESRFYEVPSGGSIDKDGQKSILPLRHQIPASAYYIKSITDVFRNIFG